MKKVLLIILSTVFLSCCGVKQSQEEDSKWKSDLQARLMMKDSIITAYKDTANMYYECRQDNLQLHLWIQSNNK